MDRHKKRDWIIACCGGSQHNTWERIWHIYMALCAALLPISLCGSYQLLKSEWDRKIYLVNWVYSRRFIVQN